MVQCCRVGIAGSIAPAPDGGFWRQSDPWNDVVVVVGESIP